MNIKRIHKVLSKDFLIFPVIPLIAFAIFMFFTTKIAHLPRNFNSIVVSASMSILIGYEYLLIKYIPSHINYTFREFRPSFKKRDYLRFSQNVNRKLQRSSFFYLTIILIITPFVFLQLVDVLKWRWGLTNLIPNFFYLHEQTTWALLLDIFNQIISFLILFMLAKIIWIIIKLTLIINELWDKDNQNKYKMKINVFDVEKKGGLGPLNSFILVIVSNYFLIIALIIISYLPPKNTAYIIQLVIEIIILILMLFPGIMLFFITQKTIRNLINDRVEIELEIINQKIKENHEKVIDMSSTKNINIDKNHLEKLQVTLDILEKEKMRIKCIKDKKFDIKTMSTFLTSISPSIFALTQKMYPTVYEDFLSILYTLYRVLLNKGIN